jgi:hypothetical protein
LAVPAVINGEEELPPSVFQSATPWLPSSAVKNSLPPTTVSP